MTSPDTVGLVTGFTQIFSSELPVLLIKKNRFSCIARLKIHHQLENHRKKIFSGKFSVAQLHTITIPKEAWSREIARIEAGGERCKYLSEERIKKLRE